MVSAEEQNAIFRVRGQNPGIEYIYLSNEKTLKHTSLTPYNYSFNNPIAFADPSGADPDPDYQNPNHQYYFHNGAGAAGYPGLTYDDWVPQSTRGEYNNAFGWRTDFALGWFGGGGQSLNAGSFSYQSARHITGVNASIMAGMIGSVNAMSFSGLVGMSFSGGRLTGTKYKSTQDLLRDAGTMIAKEKYGGDGKMTSPESSLANSGYGGSLNNDSGIGSSSGVEEQLKDVTVAFYGQLAKTELFFTIAKEGFDSYAFTDNAARYVAKLAFFAGMVGDGDQFDIKRKGKGFSRDEIGYWSIFEGNKHRFDDYGNINFGYASKIFGIVLGDALLGAGLNQIKNLSPDWGNARGFFDDRRDTQMIEYGFAFSPPWPMVKGN